MNTLKIAFLGGALLFPAAAFATYALEGNGNFISASYAAPEGNGHIDIASSATPSARPLVQTAWEERVPGGGEEREAYGGKA
jgi:hypothetical protein